jgi:nicotinamide-nucleotide amidase
MAESNLRQAAVPDGASLIEPRRGTAPGLLCPVGAKVIYALPGVPHEMMEMADRAVFPDLRRRAGTAGVILSRTLKTWGDSESGLAERLAPIVGELDRGGKVTLAFLASGIEGIKVRLTTKASDAAAAQAQIAEVEGAVRKILGTRVFGVDDETMEDVVLRLCAERGLTLAVADGVTGGLVTQRISARLDRHPEAGATLLGALVFSSASVASKLLRVTLGDSGGPAGVSAAASGIRRTLGSDVGLALWGSGAERGEIALPPEAAVPHGTGVSSPIQRTPLYFSLDMAGSVFSTEVHLPGQSEQKRSLACISALNFLRLKLMEP